VALGCISTPAPPPHCSARPLPRRRGDTLSGLVRLCHHLATSSQSCEPLTCSWSGDVTCGWRCHLWHRPSSNGPPCAGWCLLEGLLGWVAWLLGHGPRVPAAVAGAVCGLCEPSALVYQLPQQGDSVAGAAATTAAAAAATSSSSSSSQREVPGACHRKCQALAAVLGAMEASSGIHGSIRGTRAGTFV
jgi:hypothetical protein